MCEEEWEREEERTIYKHARACSCRSVCRDVLAAGFSDGRLAHQPAPYFLLCWNIKTYFSLIVVLGFFKFINLFDICWSTCHVPLSSPATLRKAK